MLGEHGGANAEARPQRRAALPRRGQKRPHRAVDAGPTRALPGNERAGIPREGPTGEKRTFHSLRHTYAKRALESGRQITWLSRHLGHSTLKVTTDIYGHWERAERRREARQMEGVFGI